MPWVDRFRWGGSPLLGAPSAAPFDPANVLFVLLPLGTAMKAWILLHLAVALAGFAAFARRLGLERAPAAVAGLVFALGGTTVSLAAFPRGAFGPLDPSVVRGVRLRPRQGAGEAHDGGRRRRGRSHPPRDAARIRVLRGVRRRRGLLLGARRRRDRGGKRCARWLSSRRARFSPPASARSRSCRGPPRPRAVSGRRGAAWAPGPRRSSRSSRRDFPSFSSTGWSRTGRSSRPPRAFRTIRISPP